MVDGDRIEPARVIEAYRATGAGVTQDRWCTSGDASDEAIECCGLGVLCLDAGMSRRELRDAGYLSVAVKLGLSQLYVAGFSLGFDGRLEPSAPVRELCWQVDGSILDAAQEAQLVELRAGIEDGARAFAAVNELDEKGELYPPGHYVDAATATGMYDRD